MTKYDGYKPDPKHKPEERARLTQSYNTRQMLDVLFCKEPYDCLKQLPFKFYFTPLEHAFQ